MKIRTTSNAPGYVRKFQRAFVASAIATFLGACAGGTGEETGNGGIAGTTPDIGAAVEATVNTDTDSIDIGSGTDVEVTTDTDSTGVDSVVDVSEGVPTDVEVDATTDTTEIPEVGSTTDTVEIPEVDSTTDTVEIPEVDSTMDIVEIPEVDSTTDTVEIPEVESTNSVPDNALGLIQSHPDLGLFATAIQSTVLTTFLADPDQRVTVFALSDKAFESLSTTQRDELFNDPTRLETLVRATTIPDRRITETSAGVVDDMQALTNGRMNLVREGDAISVGGGDGYNSLVEVVDSLENDEAVIHVIDDFINIYLPSFFPPDPGSIMDRLPEGDDYSAFSSRISRTRWYRELGNSEREWTVFLPEDGIPVEIEALESHILPREVNDPILIEAGPLTSVDGSTHMIEDTGGALTIDDIDISELNALQVNNGQVHRIVWPLGEYVSVMDRIEESYSFRFFNYGSQYRVKFFEELIRSLDETERYNDRGNRITIVIPEYCITYAEFQQLRGRNNGLDGVITMYDVYYYTRDNASFSMVPDIFPDIDTARTFLLSHTIEGIINEETLENGVGSYLQNVAGTPLAITGTTSDGIQLGGQFLSSETETVRAANGGIITTLTSLAETPDFSGWSNSSDAVLSPSPSPSAAAALIGDGTAYSEAGEAFISSFSGSLDNTDDNFDAFMFFVPSNAAMAAASLTTANVTVPVQQRHIQTSVAALVDGGTVTTVGPEGGSHAVAADADVEGGFTVGSFPVTLLGTTPEGGEIYGIEGVLP